MASLINLDFRPVVFEPFKLVYSPVYSDGPRIVVPFSDPEEPETPPPAFVADPYTSGTDGNLDSPDDQYHTVNNFVPMISKLNAGGEAGEHAILIKLGDYCWQYKHEDQTTDNHREWEGFNEGWVGSYGACLIAAKTAATPDNWDSFRGFASADDTPNNLFDDLLAEGIISRLRSQNGFKKFYFPKTGTGTIDGGWIGFYYHGQAFKNAVGGSTDNLEVATNHSVYTVGNVGDNNELVVRWDGMVGPAGQGSGIETWEVCAEDTAFAPVEPTDIEKKRLWLDYSDSDTYTVDGEGEISQINDKFGYFASRGFAQNDGDRRPDAEADTYAGVDQGGGFQEDEGEDDRMSGTTSSWFDPTDNVHIFAVAITEKDQATLISKWYGGTNKREWRLDTVRWQVNQEKDNDTDAETACAYKPTNEAGDSEDVLALYEGEWRPGERCSLWQDGVEQCRAPSPSTSFETASQYTKVGAHGQAAWNLKGDLLHVKIYVNLTHAEILWVRQNFQSLFPYSLSPADKGILPVKGIAQNHDVGTVVGGGFGE